MVESVGLGTEQWKDAVKRYPFPSFTPTLPYPPLCPTHTHHFVIKSQYHMCWFVLSISSANLLYPILANPPYPYHFLHWIVGVRAAEYPTPPARKTCWQQETWSCVGMSWGLKASILQGHLGKSCYAPTSIIRYLPTNAYVVLSLYLFNSSILLLPAHFVYHLPSSLQHPPHSLYLHVLISYSPCVQHGMLQCRFNKQNKMVGAEMMFDVMGFMQQLQVWRKKRKQDSFCIKCDAMRREKRNKSCS